MNLTTSNANTFTFPLSHNQVNLPMESGELMRQIQSKCYNIGVFHDGIFSEMEGKPVYLHDEIPKTVIAYGRLQERISMLNADFVGFPFPKTAKALPAIKDMKLEELVELILNKHSTHATRELVELEIQTDITPLSRLRFESKKSQRLGCEEGREVLSCAEMEKYTFEQLIYLLSQANSFSTQEERAKIGAIMREVRRKIINGKKISVNVFAEKLGVSNQYVSLIEIGKSSFGALFIQRFISVAMSLKEEADQYLKSIEEGQSSLNKSLIQKVVDFTIRGKKKLK